MNSSVPYLHVRSRSDKLPHGTLRCGNLYFPCLLGRTGRSFRKIEGDGKSPIGSFELKHLYFRADKSRFPGSSLMKRQITPDMGWCDAVGDRGYNREVKRPYPASHEILWRDDRAYDLIIETGHNSRPRIQGRGSAVFMHVSKTNTSPTAGCIALSPSNMRKLLAFISPRTQLIIWPTFGGLPLPRPKNG